MCVPHTCELLWFRVFFTLLIKVYKEFCFFTIKEMCSEIFTSKIHYVIAVEGRGLDIRGRSCRNVPGHLVYVTVQIWNPRQVPALFKWKSKLGRGWASNRFIVAARFFLKLTVKRQRFRLSSSYFLCKGLTFVPPPASQSPPRQESRAGQPAARIPLNTGHF